MSTPRTNSCSCQPNSTLATIVSLPDAYSLVLYFLVVQDLKPAKQIFSSSVVSWSAARANLERNCTIHYSVLPPSNIPSHWLNRTLVLNIVGMIGKLLEFWVEIHDFSSHSVGMMSIIPSVSKKKQFGIYILSSLTCCCISLGRFWGGQQFGWGTFAGWPLRIL